MEAARTSETLVNFYQNTRRCNTEDSHLLNTEYGCFRTGCTRRIFGPKRDVVSRGLRKLHNEQLHNLYSSPNIIMMITSRGMGWAGHVARKGK
jgi:hypothetical protein